jgi:hypothetical protein
MAVYHQHGRKNQLFLSGRTLRKFEAKVHFFEQFLCLRVRQIAQFADLIHQSDEFFRSKDLALLSTLLQHFDEEEHALLASRGEALSLLKYG